MAISLKESTPTQKIMAYLMKGGKSAEKELRKEYSRARHQARERIRKLKKAGFGDLPEVKNWENQFPALKELKDPRELALASSSASRFNSFSSTTVSGAEKRKQQFIDTMQERGYDIDEDNYILFRKFMDAVNDLGLSKSYGSDVIIEEVFTKLPTDANKELIESKLREWSKRKEAEASLQKRRRGGRGTKARKRR